MPSTNKITVIALWEHEIRLAMRAVRQYKKAVDDKLPDEQIHHELKNMIAACFSALHSPSYSEDTAITIMAVPTNKRKG